jgi:hypothetical protein
MAIGLDQQPERILYPLRGIDVLSAIKILQGFLIFADAAINFPTRPECDRPWIKLDRHGEVIKTASRLTKLQPGKMAIEVRMRVGRIVCNPFIDNLKIVLRIGSQKIVQHLHLFRRRRFFHLLRSFSFKTVSSRGWISAAIRRDLARHASIEVSKSAVAKIRPPATSRRSREFSLSPRAGRGSG